MPLSLQVLLSLQTATPKEGDDYYDVDDGHDYDLAVEEDEDNEDDEDTVVLLGMIVNVHVLTTCINEIFKLIASQLQSDCKLIVRCIYILSQRAPQRADVPADEEAFAPS